MEAIKEKVKLYRVVPEPYNYSPDTLFYSGRYFCFESLAYDLGAVTVLKNWYAPISSLMNVINSPGKQFFVVPSDALYKIVSLAPQICYVKPEAYRILEFEFPFDIATEHIGFGQYNEGWNTAIEVFISKDNIPTCEMAKDGRWNHIGEKLYSNQLNVQKKIKELLETYPDLQIDKSHHKLGNEELMKDINFFYRKTLSRDFKIWQDTLVDSPCITGRSWLVITDLLNYKNIEKQKDILINEGMPLDVVSNELYDELTTAVRGEQWNKHILGSWKESNPSCANPEKAKQLIKKFNQF